MTYVEVVKGMIVLPSHNISCTILLFSVYVHSHNYDYPIITIGSYSLTWANSNAFEQFPRTQKDLFVKPLLKRVMKKVEEDNTPEIKE